MSREIVQNQRGSFDFAFSLLGQFIDVCPDTLWEQKFGGWPIWQQVYHALNAVEFFILEPGREPAGPLAPREVSSLAAVGGTPIAKKSVKAFADLMKRAADAYMDGLTDSDLTIKAEGASQRMGREVLHATVMALLTGHTLYHLGSCDAALREQGLSGVF